MHLRRVCPQTAAHRSRSWQFPYDDREMRTVFRQAEAVEKFGRNVVRSHVRRRLWQRPARGVVITHNGPLTVAERREVALCTCPPRSAFGGLTALELEGLMGFASVETYVVLPEGARSPDHRALVPHWSTMLAPEDIHPAKWPRRTRTARSLVDAASWSRTDRQARTLVIASFQQRLVSARTVREALTRRGPCRRRALIVESVLDSVGGIQSLPERDFDDIRRKAGLPPPSRQVKVKGKDGRYFLDVEWSDQGIAVEIHGIPHLEVSNWDADVIRANEIVIGGRRLVAFTSYAIRHQPQLVSDQLVRLFKSVSAHAA